MADIHWRNSEDYRANYFRSNPGVFGFLYFCSQCAMPLLGRKNVEVDHVFPPSKVAIKRTTMFGTKKNTSILAVALNKKYNTVAICATCNRKKSDIVSVSRTGRGIIAKILETTIFSIQKVLLFVLWAVTKTLHKVVTLLYTQAMSPLRNPRISLLNKALILVVYVAVLFIAIKSLIG